jgi:hypothetical protein
MDVCALFDHMGTVAPVARKRAPSPIAPAARPLEEPKAVDATSHTSQTPIQLDSLFTWMPEQKIVQHSAAWFVQESHMLLKTQREGVMARTEDMNPQQRMATILALHDSHPSMIVLGAPGTGKTWWSRRVAHLIQAIYNCTVRFTGTTATAARQHERGMTLASFMGWGVKAWSKDLDAYGIALNVWNRASRAKRAMWRDTDVLFVDEMGMLSMRQQAVLDAQLRRVYCDRHGQRGGRADMNAAPAFGGVQMIYMGDFFQLPVVITPSSTDTVHPGVHAHGRRGSALTPLCVEDTSMDRVSIGVRFDIAQRQTGSTALQTSFRRLLKALRENHNAQAGGGGDDGVPEGTRAVLQYWAEHKLCTVPLPGPAQKAMSDEMWGEWWKASGWERVPDPHTALHVMGTHEERKLMTYMAMDREPWNTTIRVTATFAPWMRWVEVPISAEEAHGALNETILDHAARAQSVKHEATKVLYEPAAAAWDGGEDASHIPHAWAKKRSPEWLALAERVSRASRDGQPCVRRIPLQCRVLWRRNVLEYAPPSSGLPALVNGTTATLVGVIPWLRSVSDAVCKDKGVWTELEGSHPLASIPVEAWTLTTVTRVWNARMRKALEEWSTDAKEQHGRVGDWRIPTPRTSSDVNWMAKQGVVATMVELAERFADVTIHAEDARRKLVQGAWGVLETELQDGRRVRWVALAEEHWMSHTVTKVIKKIGTMPIATLGMAWCVPPFTLALATTVYGIQGCTCDAVVVHVNRMRAAGELQVALSRARSPEHITLVLSHTTTSSSFNGTSTGPIVWNAETVWNALRRAATTHVGATSLHTVLEDVGPLLLSDASGDVDDEGTADSFTSSSKDVDGACVWDVKDVLQRMRTRLGRAREETHTLWTRLRVEDVYSKGSEDVAGEGGDDDAWMQEVWDVEDVGWE